LVIEWICDSLGSGDSTGHDGFKSFIQVLNDCGVRARATSFDEKDHEDAVNRIREMLALEDSGPPLFEKSPRLRFIEGDTIKTYREIKNIAWIYDKKRELNKPKLDSAKLDFFSALTYALSSRNLSKSLQSYGTLKNINKSNRINNRPNIATGLGITTSKSGVLSKKYKTRRFYTRNALSRDEDE
jgi:hypothetical protein